MRWSKLKKLIEERFSETFNGRISINSTAYGNCSCGHAWLTLDKEIIANFCTRAFWNRCPKHFNAKTKSWEHDGPIPFELLAPQKNWYNSQSVEYGELSRQDAYKACWAFIHELSIEEALESNNALIQTLAVIDSRVGKRRLKKIDAESLHPLSKRLYKLRLEAIT